MSETIDNSQNTAEEDVMDLISIGEDFEITREEEKTLLGEEMSIDSPKKTIDSPMKSTTVRKPIVFDLEESEEVNEDNSSDGLRDKFRSEKKVIKFGDDLPSNRSTNAQTLQDLIQSDPKLKRYLASKSQKQELKRLSNQRRRRRDFRSEPQFNRRPDLRQFIDGERSNQMFRRSRRSFDPMLALEGQGLSSLMNWQLALGILNPSVAQTQIQNQILMSALIAQQSAPLLNRLQIPVATAMMAPKVIKPKDDIHITIDNKNRSTDQSIIKTKTQIRCHSSIDLSDSTDCEMIENVPSVPTEAKQKPQLTTLFSKHLASKAKSAGSCDGNGGSFGDALAEAEVGVDNEYLMKMKEIERKRDEILEQKRQRRLEMADERQQTAEELKIKISNGRRVSFN